MTIKAVLRDGRIQPVEPIPPAWREGQELRIEEPRFEGTAAQIDQWVKDLEASASEVPAEDHERFRIALEENERASKDAVRREWGLT
jgi:hypothetical protein